MTRRLLVLVAVWLACAGAQAVESIRCDGKIIDTGESLAYVLLTCGEPDVHVSRGVPVRGRNYLGYSFSAGVSVTDQLIYDRGWGRFPAELEFVDGRLNRIRYLPRRR
jgi:hypothetical protein